MFPGIPTFHFKPVPASRLHRRQMRRHPLFRDILRAYVICKRPILDPIPPLDQSEEVLFKEFAEEDHPILRDTEADAAILSGQMVTEEIPNEQLSAFLQGALQTLQQHRIEIENLLRVRDACCEQYMSFLQDTWSQHMQQRTAACSLASAQPHEGEAAGEGERAVGLGGFGGGQSEDDEYSDPGDLDLGGVMDGVDSDPHAAHGARMLHAHDPNQQHIQGGLGGLEAQEELAKRLAGHGGHGGHGDGSAYAHDPSVGLASHLAGIPQSFSHALSGMVPNSYGSNYMRGGDGMAVKKEVGRGEGSGTDSLDDGKRKRGRENLPAPSIVVLKDWMRANVKRPYPTDQDKQQLATLASISVQQVSNWFVNARKRIWQQMLEERYGEGGAQALMPARLKTGPNQPYDSLAAAQMGYGSLSSGGGGMSGQPLHGAAAVLLEGLAAGAAAGAPVPPQGAGGGGGGGAGGVGGYGRERDSTNTGS